MLQSKSHCGKSSKSDYLAGCAILFAFMMSASLSAQVFNVGGSYATAGSANAIVVADFDGDLDLDIAIGQLSEDTVYIHINDGAGGFSDIQKIGIPRDGGLGAADFNNDGYYDLLTYDGGWIDDDWGVTAYLNNGDGSFTRLYQDTIGSEDFTIADFDGDGFADIAVYNYLRDNLGIWIYIGHGDGTFADPVMLEPTATGWPPVAGDLDNDGDIDLLYRVSGDAYCRLNNGDGSFAAPFNSQAGSALGDLTDLNGDHYPELVRREIYGCSGHAAFLIGHGDGTFGPPQSAWITAGLLHGIDLAEADFSGDGYVDIALYAPENSYVDVGFDDGRLNYEPFHEEIPLSSGGIHLATADFDGDGDYDLAALGNDNTLTIVFSRGAQHSRIHVVPDDFATVQEAVNAAWNLDTIFVCAGTYYGPIDFDGKNLVLMSIDCSKSLRNAYLSDALSRAAVTILDGGDTARVFTFDNGEDDRSVISGFTIQHGNAAGLGGAIYCYDTAAPTITNNIIRNNFASSAGGAIFVGTGRAKVDHNLIYNNSSGYIGGAMYISGPTTITHNTVYGNSTEDHCGGLYLGYGTPTVCNNIFWNNSSTLNENELGPATALTLFVTYSVVQGGFSGMGNIDADPLFVDPANGDFNLLPGSPCIDAGDPSLPPDPDGTRPDIGACYYPDPLDVDDDVDNTLPYRFELAQNYPNPFNPTTTIEYTLPRKNHVTLEIYNILGQRVRNLTFDEQSAGDHAIEWDGRDERGRPTSSGIYFYRLKAGSFSEAKKMILIK